MSAPAGMLRLFVLDWAIAIVVLVALPVAAGATYHYLYGAVPGLVMFAGAAGAGVLLVFAWLLRPREVRR